VAVLAAAPVPAASAEEPPVVRAKTGKTVVRATLGSFCWRRDEATSMCGDAAYPLPTQGALPWRPRAPLVFGTSAPVDRLEPCLSRVEDGRDTPLNVCLAVQRGSDGKWRGQLPKNLRGANRLWIWVERGTDQAHYSAAISR
jgi:hypothetical protein